MFRVTLDTNTLISATIAKGNEYELLKLAQLGKIKLVLSLQILKEFKEVISRPRFNYTIPVIDEIVERILNISEIIIPKEKVNIVKEDPSDNKFIECALSGNVNYIVSGDNHLLKIKQYKGIKIIRTSEILKKFKDII